MITTFVIDDEPIARKGLRTLLSDDPDIEIIGEYSNGSDAVHAIRKLKPQLIFLDVQMPDLDGFGVLQSLSLEEIPAVVFVTAYDDYAIQAFEVNAVDYLLKPFDRDRFQEALRRAKKTLAGQELEGLADKMRALLNDTARKPRSRAVSQVADRLLIKDRGSVRLIKCDEIDWIESTGNYLRIYVGGNSYLHRESMASICNRLDPSTFLRISRSRLINAERVTELKKLPNGCYRISLNPGGVQISSSRRFTPQIGEFFEEFK